MVFKVAVQMDPIELININGDSTFRIMEEAQSRGHQLFYYTPDQLAFEQGIITVAGWPITVRREKNNHVTKGDFQRVPLLDFDVVWLRQDPPFDMAYITTTHLLDMIHPQTLVINNPTWVRNYPEKLLVLRFPDFIPPTTIAYDLDVLKRFKDVHQDIILKPLYGNGGSGVFRLRKDDTNLNALHELFATINKEPLIVQKFLPDVTKGDKRIILIDGQPVGAINRIPAKGEMRSNLHVGGQAVKANITQREYEICAAIGPLLREKGQVFVGIDVIAGYLTEINVTSPTGIQELERFDNINVSEKIWHVIEERVKVLGDRK